MGQSFLRPCWDGAVLTGSFNRIFLLSACGVPNLPLHLALADPAETATRQLLDTFPYVRGWQLCQLRPKPISSRVAIWRSNLLF